MIFHYNSERKTMMTRRDIHQVEIRTKLRMNQKKQKMDHINIRIVRKGRMKNHRIVNVLMKKVRKRSTIMIKRRRKAKQKENL